MLSSTSGCLRTLSAGAQPRWESVVRNPLKHWQNGHRPPAPAYSTVISSRGEVMNEVVGSAEITRHTL